MSKRIHATRICLVAGICLLTFSISGCKVGPDYVRPEYEVPDQWHQTAVKGLEDGSANLQTWWTVFGDPVLENLIEQAQAENLELQIAYVRVMEARALRGIASGEYWPTVDAAGFYSRNRVSENGLTAPAVGSPDQMNLHSTGVDSSWEIDVFGRISRSVESAQASIEASVEDYRDVLVSLYSQVAQTYIDVRSLQTRIQYARDNVTLQRDTLKLTQDRRKAGLVPQLDIEQAKLVLASTESIIPRLRQLESQSVHRLSVLLGQPPAALYGKLSTTSDIPEVPEKVVAGLPAELLRQRPDIRRAERVLAVETADIGIATAGLYPAFSLSGTFALEAQQIKDVGNWNSRTWGFGPAMRWNLFDGNRIRSGIKVQEAQTEQALLNYKQTVLRALEEVESVMVAYKEEQQRFKTLERSVAAAQKSVELVQALYENGLTDFQNVLDMQRVLTAEQDKLAESEGQVVKNLVGLYKSLGGGWSAKASKPQNSDQ